MWTDTVLAEVTHRRARSHTHTHTHTHTLLSLPRDVQLMCVWMPSEQLQILSSPCQVCSHQLLSLLPLRLLTFCRVFVPSQPFTSNSPYTTHSLSLSLSLSLSTPPPPIALEANNSTCCNNTLWGKTALIKQTKLLSFLSPGFKTKCRQRSNRPSCGAPVQCVFNGFL